MDLKQAKDIIFRKIVEDDPLQYGWAGSEVPIEERLATLETRLEAEGELSQFRIESVASIYKKLAEHFGMSLAEISKLPETTPLPPDIEALIRRFEKFPFEDVPD